MLDYGVVRFGNFVTIESIYYRDSIAEMKSRSISSTTYSLPNRAIVQFNDCLSLQVMMSR